jgi:hypothetical protein
MNMTRKNKDFSPWRPRKKGPTATSTLLSLRILVTSDRKRDMYGHAFVKDLEEVVAYCMLPNVVFLIRPVRMDVIGNTFRPLCYVKDGCKNPEYEMTYPIHHFEDCCAISHVVEYLGHWQLDIQNDLRTVGTGLYHSTEAHLYIS